MNLRHPPRLHGVAVVPTTMAVGLSIGCVAAAHAVMLVPGASHEFRDRFNAEIHTPGVALATDASLAGAVVADTLRPFTIEVTFRSSMSEETRTYTVSGQIRDWVVRRDDTGTLDFYFSMQLPSPASFAGTVTRPWDLGGAGGVQAHWRDDGVPGGNPPTEAALALDGESVVTLYYATDDGTPNWVSDGTAPMLYRSTLTGYRVGEGRLSYSYSPVFGSNSGSTPLAFFMPAIPEPSTWALLLAGLLVVGGASRETRTRKR